MTALLVVTLPVLGALLVFAVGHRSERVGQGIAVATTAASWLSALALGAAHWGDAAPEVVGEHRLPTGGLDITVALYVDPLAASIVVLATTVALLVQVYSVGYLRGDPRYPSYAALVALFTAAMSLVALADDLFVLLVGWEVMGACSYFLIGHHWELPAARSGAVKAFVMTRLGDIGLLFGIFAAGQAAGTYRISGVVQAATDGGISTGEATLVSLLLLCGAVGKSAQFPLHSWLPDAMPGPTPISALIHAATMVAAGVYLVARLMSVFDLSYVALSVLAAIAVVTMLGGALFALVSDDLKRVLAWSTVSQLAYMFGALSIGGVTAATLHLLAHGAFKALLFLAAGSVIHAVGTQRLGDMGGVRRSMPWTFVTMSIGFAALAGVPPLVGFFSKDAVLTLAADEALSSDPTLRSWLVLVIGLAVVLLTAGYAMRAWLMVFFGGGRTRQAEPAESSPSMVGPLVVLALFTLVGGTFVLSPQFLGVDSEPLRVSMVALSAALVAVALVFTYAEWWRSEAGDPATGLGRLGRPLAAELGYDRMVDRAVVRPTTWAAGVTMASEQHVVEPYVAGADAGAQWSGRLMRWLHDGDLQRYVTIVVAGAVAVALLVGVAQ